VTGLGGLGLSMRDPSASPPNAKLGFNDGRNLVLDKRAGNAATLPQLAKDLV
jgi:hypothetical protein